MLGMFVLGLTCCFSTLDEEFIPELPRWFGHDSAAALVSDGTVIAAIEEERLNRAKHTNKFAARSARACLEYAGLSLNDADRIAYFFEEEDNDKELNLLYAEHPTVPLRYSRELIAENLGAACKVEVDPAKIRFVHHHTAHAYAAYFQSGFDDALVCILDGSGERESGSMYSARGRNLQLVRSFPPSKSLGHLYSTAIELLAYSVFDEYKVMGLAPHGDPARYRSLFRSCYELTVDGGYEMEYSRFRSRFLLEGFRPRRKGEPFTQEHKDFAAGLQETLETISSHILAACREQTGHRRLCLSGGVALNCSMNGQLLKSGMFERMFVHPASHDAGAAIGAALYVSCHEALDRFKPAPLSHVYWGTTAGNRTEIEKTLGRWGAFLETRPNEDICAETAALLANGAVVAWVQGRSEFGPRALGNRSILADPRPEENRVRINQLVKKREEYRPFAPSVLVEEVETYFDVPPGAPPLDYMVVVVDVRPEYRSTLGAITHVDGTARIQTVNRATNERYWSLIHEFGRLTGVPILLNTSFNNYAEPIVQSVADAVECFLTTKLDYLVVDNYLVRKRTAEWDAYLKLVPVLNSPAGLRMTAGTLQGDASPRTQHEIYFRYTKGARSDISPEVFAALLKADGAQTLGELGVNTQPLIEEVLTLWERRFLRLTP
jgi:predicted NodU family carbamoyl transferase